ncbi:hypothetical protein [Pseudoalteromonas sp. EB27]|uniref:hypothetical protein n=1 Tax=Pseudoalteromonas sp. EB27 TaxID=1938368 RepID=UPI00117AFE79|nr:hypothetical protein [Pseudoalteromonas sp. EB27]
MKEIAEVSDKLLNIQKKDGGFDIGYDFNFGFEHKKGESTSPELYAVTVLNVSYDILVEYSEYSELSKKIKKSIVAAVNWIKIHSRLKHEGSSEWVIPYGPYSTNKTMVYNGVSFAAGALGPSIRFFNESEKEILINIYDGFCLYLLNSLTSGKHGDFWFYNDQERTDLSTLKREKIDYYHQAQQLEVHCIAEQYQSNQNQNEIIKRSWKILSFMAVKYNGRVPYTNSDIYFRGHYHLWGLASIASALSTCKKFVSIEEHPAITNALFNVANFITEKAWSGEFFHAVLDKNEKPLTELPFMPRSDAWVVASLSKVVADSAKFDETMLEKVITSYESIKKCDFSGPENHSVDFKKKLVINLYKFKNGR